MNPFGPVKPSKTEQYLGKVPVKVISVRDMGLIKVQKQGRDERMQEDCGKLRVTFLFLYISMFSVLSSWC